MRLEQLNSKKHDKSLSFALLMVRDALVFLLCVLTLVLVSVITARSKTYALTQTEYQKAVSSGEPAETSDTLPVDSAAPAARSRPAVPRMARRPFSRKGGKGNEHRLIDPRRKG